MRQRSLRCDASDRIANCVSVSLAGEFIRIYQRALAADPNNLAALVDMAAIDSTMAGGYQAADRAGKLDSARRR